MKELKQIIQSMMTTVKTIIHDSYLDAKKFLCCTQKRDFTISLKEPLPLILRGGENSLERGLADEARDLGVDFHFKSRPKPKAGDIMATGSYRTDMAAFGAYYELSLIHI